MNQTKAPDLSDFTTVVKIHPNVAAIASPAAKSDTPQEPSAGTHHHEVRPRRHVFILSQLLVQWRDIRYEVPEQIKGTKKAGSKKAILKGISGHVAPGEMLVSA